MIAASRDLKFYANMERRTQGNLSKEIFNSLQDAVFALSKLSVSKDPSALSGYIKAFKEKFDLRMIPLMEAIDPETGVSYDNLAAPTSQSTISDKIMPFLEKSVSDELLTWGKVNRLLLNNWPVSAGEAIELTEKLLNELEDHQQAMPPSFSVLFRVSGKHVQIDQAGGTSATALVGRFTPFSPYIRDHARDIADREATLNPEVIFAEVVLISDAHVDNINRRETVRDHEIPIMTGSQLPFDQQIMISDLFLMVRGNALILWSEKLKRRIIPRISSAFNYQRNNLAVFRLLRDLQYQGVHHTYSF